MSWGDGGVQDLSAGRYLTGLLVVELPVGDDHRHVGVLLHHAEFLLQFHWVCPEVIACTVGYIFTPTLQQTVEVVVRDTFVMFVAEQTDYVGIPFSIILADGACSVCRCVFPDDDLKGQMALLHQYGIDRSRYGVLLVVGDDDDRNDVLHYRSFFMSGSVARSIFRPKRLFVILRNQMYFVL